jgi:hypothetical protein
MVMGIFDKVIEDFSAKDLHTRVNRVMLLGAALCLIIVASLGILLTSTRTIAIEGTGRWAAAEPNVLEISIERGPLQKLLDEPNPALELLDPAHGRVRVQAPLIAIDPQRGVVQFEGSAIPGTIRAIPRLEARIIVLEAPLWRLLWGR